jgi:hypothetical protein
MRERAAAFAVTGTMIGAALGGGSIYLAENGNKVDRTIARYCEHRYDTTKFLTRAAINCMNNDTNIPGDDGGEVLDADNLHPGEIAQPTYNNYPEGITIGLGGLILVAGGIGGIFVESLIPQDKRII